MWELMSAIDFSPLFLSMKTGILATIFTFFLGTGAARGVMKLNHRVKSIVDGILTLPLVLPPTVAGFFLLLIFNFLVKTFFFLNKSSFLTLNFCSSFAQILFSFRS